MGCRQAGNQPPGDTPPGEREAAIVTRVHDGDSGLVEIEDSEVEFRLQGLNAPEREECHHDEAREHLIDLLGDGTVEIVSGGIDQFGRTLANLWRGDAPVNLAMVASGSAIATTPEDGDPMGDALLDAEEEAATEHIGLWGEDACGGGPPLPSLAVDPRASSFDPPGPDEETLDQEWVTLTSESTVDLEGWTLRDESSAHRCRLPAGSRLSPGSDLVVTSADECWEPGNTPVWNNGGDMVLVLDDRGRVAAWHRYRG